MAFPFAYTLTKYKGQFLLPPFVSAEIVDEFHELDLRPEDVFIVTYPKSGTHWMQEIVHLIYADGDANKVDPNRPMEMAEMINRATLEAGSIAGGIPNFRLQKDSPSPRIFSTHLPSKLLPAQIWQKRCKVIHVVRHPKDVICSMYNFSRKLALHNMSNDADTPEKFDEFFQNFIADDVVYGGWFDHVSDYSAHKDKDFFLFVSFEEMKKDISTVTKRISEFLGRRIDEGTVQKVVDGSTFAAMKKTFEGTLGTNKDIFLNKGTTAQWKTRFTEEQNKQFGEVFREKSEGCELAIAYTSSLCS